MNLTVNGEEQQVSDGLRFLNDLEVPSWTGLDGGERIFCLSENPPMELDPGAYARMMSKIPLLIERLGNHDPPGGNVLYLDGHFEWHSYPYSWPMTEKTVSILESLDNL